MFHFLYHASIIKLFIFYFYFYPKIIFEALIPVSKAIFNEIQENEQWMFNDQFLIFKCFLQFCLNKTHFSMLNVVLTIVRIYFSSQINYFSFRASKLIENSNFVTSDFFFVILLWQKSFYSSYVDFWVVPKISTVERQIWILKNSRILILLIMKSFIW